MQILWAEISGYPNYEVSSDGRVRNVKTGKLLLPRYKWNRAKTKIQCARIVLKGKDEFSIHRLMYQTFVGVIPDDMRVDHIDRDPLNNVLSNLRLLTNAGNTRNTDYHKNRKTQSKYIGVNPRCRNRKGTIKYQASTKHMGKSIFIGNFDTELEAAIAYDKKVLELGYDHTMTNFPAQGEH